MVTIDEGMERAPALAKDEVRDDTNGRPDGKTERIVATRPHRRLTQAELDGFLEKAAALVRRSVSLNMKLLFLPPELVVSASVCVAARRR